MIKKERRHQRNNKSLNYGRIDRTCDLIDEALLSKRTTDRGEHGSGSYKMRPRESSKYLKSKDCQPRRALNKMLKRMGRTSSTNSKLLGMTPRPENQELEFEELLLRYNKAREPEPLPPRELEPEDKDQDAHVVFPPKKEEKASQLFAGPQKEAEFP